MKKVGIACQVFIMTMLLQISCSTSLKRTPNPAILQTGYVGHARYYSDSLAENSLPLYHHLADLGYKIVECDVLFTQDGIPILSHEVILDSLARFPDGRKCSLAVNSMTFDQISRLNFSRGGG